ncbi:MAG TPA: endolytic transglycosylase MltG [Fimbriimonadales bacterium]|nr:endolytic transglycosylase MltG [Fimbriimonadales bacterium]
MTLTKRLWIFVFFALLLAFSLALFFYSRALAPASEERKGIYIRVLPGEGIANVLRRLEGARVLKSATAAKMYASLFHRNSKLVEGTYELSPSMSAPEILNVLFSGKPIRQFITIREGLWMERIASLLAERSVASREELLEAFRHREHCREILGFEIPAKTLEGYLFPDTYDFPPLCGADTVIRKMLTAFRKKVYERLKKPSPEKMHKWLIIASMVELEAVKDEERARIAGVIYNRLARKMKLQIDATVAYAKGEWSPVTRADYRIKHPYNTYVIDGLPPGPICSPGLASILAAISPEKHEWLYYVAMPDRSHRFAKTYEEHLKNIEKSRKAFEKAQ